MHSLWLNGPSSYLRRDHKVPVPKPGEALIAVRLAGICGTDLALWAGYADFFGVPGHEFVGTVVGAPGHEKWVGKRVVGDINVGCGQCRECEQGNAKHCRNRRVLGIRNLAGAFADFIVLPVCNLVRVPDDMPDEVAVFAEPVAAALRIGAQLGDLSQRDVLVVGAGRLGQLVARALQGTVRSLNVMARYPAQRSRLRAAGVDALPAGKPFADGADVVIDTTGKAAAIAKSLAMVRPQGELVVKTSCRLPVIMDLANLMVDEKIVRGSRCGSIPDAIKALASGRIETGDLIDARYPLQNANKALMHAARAGVLKVLIAPC